MNTLGNWQLNVPAKEYHSWDLPSASRLSAMRRSPAHCLASMSSEATAAMALGTAIHVAVLEPKAFEARYLRALEGDGRTKAVQEARAAQAATANGREILKPDDFDTCLAVRDACSRHAFVREIIGALDGVELTACWHHFDRHDLMKSRVDGLSRELSATIDVKSTQDARRHAFERSIFNYGYHIQGAVYTDAAMMCETGVKSHILIAVEKTRPYGICVYRLDDLALAQGRREYRDLLARYVRCKEAASWPGYEEEITDITLPSWAMDAETQEEFYGN